jgi:ferredoxin
MDLYPYLTVAGIAGVVALLFVVYKMSQMSSDTEGWWTKSILEGRQVRVKTDWDLCMGSGSCTELAPGIFRLDWSKKKSVFDPAPLQVLEDKGTKPEDIFRAAQSCPYRAILLEDQVTGERLFPLG